MTPVATDGDGRLRVGVAVARFNEVVTDALLEGALAALAEAGVAPGDVTVVRVPGAFELPLAAQRLAAAGNVDAVVCLGAVIRGATDHHVHVGGQCAAGLQRVQLDTGIPVTLGVLTTDTLEQALERAGAREPGNPRANRGYDAAMAAVDTARTLAGLPPAAGSGISGPVHSG